MGGEVAYTENTRAKGAVDGWSGRETPSGAADVDPTMTRHIRAVIAHHYTGRRGLDASYLTRAAAKAAPQGGGGDYGPDSGGYDQLGFGTLAFTRDPEPGRLVRLAVSAHRHRHRHRHRHPGWPGEDLAATGTSDVPAWTAAGGVAALAGGLLLLRRRNRAEGGSET
jgi:LPXTG-motif cell wall-anchored protein